MLLVAFFIIGFFGIGSLGIGMETSCETVFPVDSGIVAGMLLSAGYFFYILLAIGTLFTRNHVSYEEYPTEQCSNGSFYQFYEFSDTTEVLSFITCAGLVLCLLGLHARRRRYDYEAAAKLMRISVFNTSHSTIPFRHFPTASTSQAHLATEF
uniref:NADH dehydrogenase subunit 6 n=1 Tax=Panagrolaimus sp. ES5 TaxID=591445 RepID=A0AC34FRS4_9BILA